MLVPDPGGPIPYVPVLTNTNPFTLRITTEDVQQHMSQVDSNQASGPDNMNPYILKCLPHNHIPAMHYH